MLEYQCLTYEKSQALNCFFVWPQLRSYGIVHRYPAYRLAASPASETINFNAAFQVFVGCLHLTPIES